MPNFCVLFAFLQGICSREKELAPFESKFYSFRVNLFMPPHQMMPGAYSFWFSYVGTNVRPSLRMCVCTYIGMYVILLDSGFRGD